MGTRRMKVCKVEMCSLVSLKLVHVGTFSKSFDNLSAVT